MTNQQTQFLAERLLGVELVPIDAFTMFYKRPDGSGWTAGNWNPQHNPAHSRMVKNAMLDLGYYCTQKNNRGFVNKDGVTTQLHVVSFDIWAGVESHGWAENENEDQAICDAAEAALRSEE